MRSAPAIVAVLLAAACGAACERTLDLPFGPSGLEIVSGDAQTAIAGETLALPLVVRVDDGGLPLPGVIVTWTAPEGATVFPETSVTGTDGLASTTATLPPIAGPAAFGASAPGRSAMFAASGRPVLRDVLPALARIETPIRVLGAGFGATASVRIDGAAVPATLVSSTALTFSMPSVEAAGVVTVSVGGVAALESASVTELVDRTAVEVPGLDGCTFGNSNVTRPVSTDAAGRIYIAATCPAGVTLVTSADGGKTFGTPQVAVGGSTDASVQGGAAGVAVVAYLADLDAFVRSTTNGGLSFSASGLIGPDGELSVTSDGTRIWAASFQGSTIDWLRTDDGGRSFVDGNLVLPNVYGDFAADPSTGTLWAAGDSPSFRIRRSDNGGASFGSEQTPAGSVTLSDWAAGGGTLYACGSDAMFAFDAETLTSRAISGFPGNVEHAVAADATGTAVVVIRGGGLGAITLQRAKAAETALTAAIPIADAGTTPGVARIGTNATAVVHVANGKVLFSVRIDSD